MARENVRLGLIVPSSNTTMEPEFNKLIGEHGTVHAARLRLREVTLEELQEMEERRDEAALQLSDAKVDVICYGCTSGSLFRGIGHDAEIAAQLERISGIPAVATSGAVVESLRKLSCRKIGVATPYEEEINLREKRFLEGNDFEVVRIRGLGIRENTKIGSLPPEVALDLATEVGEGEVDGVFISCTNFRTIEILDQAEALLNKPVVSSNTATFSSMIKRIGFQYRPRGYGRIFSTQ